MTAVAETAAHEYGTDRGFSDEGERHVVWKRGNKRITVHFANLIERGGVKRGAG